MPLPTIAKATAYITRGPLLLVFDHVEYPDQAPQVPAGTMEPGETPSQAVLREAREETGLDDLQISRYLGDIVVGVETARGPEVHHRHFFHLLCPGPTPERWQHEETCGGTRAPIPLELYWVRMPHEIPEMDPVLSARLGDLLDGLSLGG